VVKEPEEEESETEEDDEFVASDSEAPKSSMPFEFLVEFEEGALLTLQSIDDMIGAILSLLLGLDYASRIAILQSEEPYNSTLINYPRLTSAIQNTTRKCRESENLILQS
jgi:hypothetical protein